jgi:hypothetical protein
VGARGPARKARGATADDRNGQQGVEVDLAQARAELDVPAPPTGLLACVRDEWTEFWDSDVALLLQPSDYAVLRRLFKLKDEQERCYREVRKTKTTTIPEKLDKDGHIIRDAQDVEHSGRLAFGSQGQMVLSPEARYQVTLAAEIRQLEDRLAQNLRARAALQQVVVSPGTYTPETSDTPAVAGGEDPDRAFDAL